MATVAGTITGVKTILANPSGVGAREEYLITVDFGAYTGASDDATVAAVGAAIAASKRDGGTYTLRDAICAFAGKDTNNQAVYTNSPTVSTDALTFNLANAAGTELTSATASVGVGIIVSVDKS